MAREVIKDTNIDKILFYYDAGKSATDIAKIVGLTTLRVEAIIRDRRGGYFDPKDSNLYRSSFTSDTINRLYDEGKSSEEIANLFGTSTYFINSFIRDRFAVSISEVEAAPVNIYKLAKFRDNLEIGSKYKIRVRKESQAAGNNKVCYVFEVATVLSKYPFIVRTDIGDFQYFDLFIGTKVG